jgi:hypothetical protein
MKARPILFNTAMVRAILDGRKTQTRLVVKHVPHKDSPYHTADGIAARCPYGRPGDLLWVRETWSTNGMQTVYRAGHSALTEGINDACLKWRPSIHMPRWASRITLRVASVRIERVMEISDRDALAEGVSLRAVEAAAGGWKFPATIVFAGLWDSINERRGYGWASNPWVWVIEFALESVREKGLVTE